MNRKKNAPTMKDVAQEAGVALGTVSKVFNGLPVGEAYRARVLEAAKKLDYQVNSYARGLRSSKTNTVSVILPSLSHPFFGTFADHVCVALQQRKYRMLLSTTSYDPHVEQRCIDMVQQNKVDGIIAITYNPDLEIDSDIPFVIIDRKFSTPVPCVTSDNFQGGELAAEKLHQLGCKKLLFLGSSSRVPGEADKRGAGFLSYCMRNGIEHHSLALYDEEAEQFWDYLQKQLTDTGFAYDGIFCNTDSLAVRTMKQLQSLGVPVPAAVQLIGYDGIRSFGTGDYYCSTIVQPIRQMAENAVEILLDGDHSNLPALICLPVAYQPGGTTRDSAT